MKAIVCAGHGSPDVLELQEIAKPVPDQDQVLIRVYASTVTSGDVVMLKLHPLAYLVMGPFGIKRKKIPGHEYAGEIEAVGNQVKSFRVGDQVFGTTTGLSVGANADYVCVPEAWSRGVLALKPGNLPYEEAAAVPVGGMTALFFLGNGKIRKGQKVLIYGASGSVGTYAVQLARYFGAHVTGVCSTANVELVKSLGAEAVIDYIGDDLTKHTEVYDIIFDAVGKSSTAESQKLLNRDGLFLTVASSTSEKTENLLFLKELIEAGHLRPVIDRRYPLEQIAQAYRHVEKGHKRGNVVITPFVPA